MKGIWLVVLYKSNQQKLLSERLNLHCARARAHTHKMLVREIVSLCAFVILITLRKLQKSPFLLLLYIFFVTFDIFRYRLKQRSFFFRAQRKQSNAVYSQLDEIFPVWLNNYNRRIHTTHSKTNMQKTRKKIN